jgi:hypothetical protein
MSAARNCLSCPFAFLDCGERWARHRLPRRESQIHLVDAIGINQGSETNRIAIDVA